MHGYLHLTTFHSSLTSIDNKKQIVQGPIENTTNIGVNVLLQLIAEKNARNIFYFHSYPPLGYIFIAVQTQHFRFTEI